MSIAVIKTGGKQYKVKVGDRIKIEKINQKPKTKNQKLEFEDILGGKKVTAEIIKQGKNKKIRVLKYKPKTGYRRVHGHRQSYTTLKILEIK